MPAALKHPTPPKGETLDSAAIEAQAAAAAEWRRVHDHPHIVTLLADGTRDGKGVWLLTEYCAAGSLGEWADGREVSVDYALWAGARLADALTHAHRGAVYHHDISPGNVLLDGDADWPVPKLADWESGAADGAEPGYTPGFAAPEQRPRTNHTTDGAPAAVDLYQLAAVVYDLLVGEPPAPDDEEGRVDDRPPRASERRPLVPDQVDKALTTALSPDPRKRQSTAAFARTLDRQVDPRDEW